MVDQRDGNGGPMVTDRQAREAWLSAAAQLGMANRAPQDVLAALTTRLQERDHLHQVVADIAETGGVDRQSPIRDLTNRVREMSGQAPIPLQLTEILGVDRGVPARTVLQTIRQLVDDRADLAKAMADVKDALGVPLEATQQALLDKIRALLNGHAESQEKATESTLRGGVAFTGRIRQALGLPQETTHEQITAAVAELRLQTKTAHMLADLLGMGDAPARALLDRVRQLKADAAAVRDTYDQDGMATSEQVALWKELAEEVRATLELPADASNRAVLNRVSNLRATRAQHDAAERTLRDQIAGMLAALQARVGLTAAADWVDILEAVEQATGPRVETITMEEADRQRSAREAALHSVMDLWAQHRLGDEPDAESLVAMAAYLATGDMSLLQDANRRRIDRSYELRRQELGVTGSAVDGARWTPGDHGG